MTCSELLDLVVFFWEAAPSSGEGSNLCPLGDPHFPTPGFYLLPKDHRTFSVRAEGPTPFLWQEWGTLSFSFFAPEQGLLHLGLWGWEDPLA